MTQTFKYLQVPPFCFEIDSNIAHVAHNLEIIYQHHFSAKAATPDYFLSLQHGAGLRRYLKPQARFFCDQHEPFKPLAVEQGYALLEWGMNWAIATQEMRFVIVHAAVLAKGNQAILFPAPPGSGKSTLTCWLAFNGWRLLSDEMALIIPNSRTVVPFVRPICLKNQSIQLAKSWFPQARFSSVAKNTHKGDVVHMSPPAESWLHNTVPAEICAIVFPQYQAAQPLTITQLNQAEGFMSLAENAFNFSLLGEAGFNTVTKLIEQVQIFEISYANLAEVAEFLQQDVIGDEA